MKNSHETGTHPSIDQPAAYECAGFRVDARRRTLEREGRVVPLYPRSFDVLLFLIEHHGELLGKERLLRELWKEVVVEDNSLAQAISDIRRALGEAAGCIVTVPRRGYRFEGQVSAVTVAATQSAKTVASIAVLPFSSIGGEQTDQYLAFGMADALVTRLSSVKQIIVRPTSSVAKYAETPISPVVAGRELSVDAVLTGNIRRAGSRVRVTVQLIDVHSERSLWAEKYDESSADVFAIEDSISARVAAALAVEMPGEQRRSLTRSNEAYELYQRGRFWVSRRTGETARRAAECYRKALAIDPDFALAHAGLAETYIVATALGVIADAVPARTTMPLVREAAERALQIDPHMAEAHAAIGHFRFFYEWNWPAAQAAFLRAIALKPNYMMGHHWYAMALSAMGLADEALAQIRRAREIEPTSILIASNAGFILHRARRYEEALVELDNAVIMDAGLVHARYRLGLTLQALGRHAEALSEFEAVIRLGKGEALGLGAKAHLLAEMGERAAAEKLVSEMLAIAESRYVPAYLIAEVYAGLGDPDRAIEWLERAYEERTNLLTSLHVNRKCDPLRSDPRFQSIVDRVGLWRG